MDYKSSFRFTLDIPTINLIYFSIQGLIATYALPVATLSAVTLGGINFFQNNVQEDVLREHKRLIDQLRRDLDKIEGYDESPLVGKNMLMK